MQSNKLFWYPSMRPFFKWPALYPAPVPLPHTRSFWVATGCVTVLASLFSTYFILYVTGLQDAYLTHAEDFGIMDQALWSASHGQLFHQTICNIISDTNCVGPAGISRFAIHFEPILFLIAALYIFLPAPKMLLIIQTLIVAAGAFPAFWLARLRLRNEWAAVIVAALYLLYPALQLAIIDAFHAVTFTAALLLFVLYFLYTRRTAWLFLFAILAMACKEEIPAVIACCGLWSLIFQYRWRTGLALIALALCWIVMTFSLMRIASPTGQPLLAGRYTVLGHDPITILHTLLAHPRTMLKLYVLEPDHRMYLRTLLSPTGYIVLFAPWVLCLAFPSLALNLLSSNKQMYSGLFQYNAEIVPILIFALIEALVVILYLTRLILRRFDSSMKAPVLVSGRSSLIVPIPRWRHSAYMFVLIVVLCMTVFEMYRADVARGVMPFSEGFSWPQTSPHVALAASFLSLIPPTASVSAQSNLVPHLSQRKNIYLFPYQDTHADYVFLDVTSEVYPFWSAFDYMREAKRVLLSGEYGVVAAHDGYILLKRGLAPPELSPFSAVHPGSKVDTGLLLPDLPPQFCSYVQASITEIQRPVQVVFSPANDASSRMELIGYSVGARSTMSISAGFLSVTTYWRLTTPVQTPLQILLFMSDRNGNEHFLSTDVPAVYWCQTNAWRPGTIIRLSSVVIGLHDLSLEPGPTRLSLALVPLAQPSAKLMDTQARLPLQVVHAANHVLPAASAFPLMQLTLVA